VKYLKQLFFQRSQSETIHDRGLVAAMIWLKGWPITYGGIAALSVGAWINSGADTGLITGGLCLIVAGLIQLAKACNL
jgi:hypothetical protein